MRGGGAAAARGVGVARVWRDDGAAAVARRRRGGGSERAQRGGEVTAPPQRDGEAATKAQQRSVEVAGALAIPRAARPSYGLRWRCANRERESRNASRECQTRAPTEHANRERRPRSRIETWPSHGRCAWRDGRCDRARDSHDWREWARRKSLKSQMRRGPPRQEHGAKAAVRLALAWRDPRWRTEGARARGRCEAAAGRNRRSLQVVAQAKAGRPGRPGGRGKAALVAGSQGRSQGRALGLLPLRNGAAEL